MKPTYKQVVKETKRILAVNEFCSFLRAVRYLRRMGLPFESAKSMANEIRVGMITR